MFELHKHHQDLEHDRVLLIRPGKRLQNGLCADSDPAAAVRSLTALLDKRVCLAPPSGQNLKKTLSK